MDGQSDIRSSSTEVWHSCKPGAVCMHGSWNPSRLGGRIAAEIDDNLLKSEGTEEVVLALALAVEHRDRHTAGHCERLALISVSMGLAMGLETASLLVLYRGGYLHDIGKIGIPDSILFKPGKLTADEWSTMQSHTTRGAEICKPMKTLRPVLPLIRHHHERWDGSGYPDGLRGEKIPLMARILQISDIYDALISPRPYKPAYSADEALRTIQEETDRGWRDPYLVKTFMGLHGKVISKVADFASEPDRDLTAMRSSISGLEQFLAMSPA